MASFARTVRTVVVAGTVVTAGVGIPAFVPGSHGTAQAQTASQIVVQGNRRVDADTVRSYFGGGREALTPARIDEGVKALYATGLFSDVRVSRQGGRVVVSVSENLVINRVVFEGNRRVRSEQLANEVESRPRGAFSRATVQADTQRIYDIYRRTGRYDVEVTPKVIDQPNGRVDLVFEITEGRKATIRSINFVGNRAFGNQRLRDVMSTGETGIFSWLRSNDVYDADRLNADQEALRRLYLRHGYADFRVLSARADFDQAANAFTITIEMEEGEQYRFGTVDVQSNIRDVDGSTLMRAVRTSAGAVYNVELVDKTLEDITVAVAQRGYAFATVRPRGERDPATRTVNIVYVVEEGPRVYVERINVRGNTRTQDRVIRREFDMAEGDAYNRVLVDRAERRLRNLNFFKNVRIATEPGSAPDRVIVNVDVEDQATGAFSIAGGYSTSDGFIAEVSVEERNFLGRGQFVRLGGSVGQFTRGVNFSFTEPFFLDYRISAGFDLFYRAQSVTSYQSFASDSYGGTIRFGVPLTENFAVQLRYSAYAQRIRLSDVFANCITFAAIPGNANAAPACFDDGEASIALRDLNNRTRFVSMLGYSLIYNSLDRPNNPASGIYAELRQDVAGLGGDARFLRTTFEGRAYYDLSNDWIASLRLQAGNITGFANRANGGRLDVTDQFFMGPELVRGFQSAGIGPRDFASVSVANNRVPDSLGGTNYWGASAEVTFPIAFLPRDFGMRGAIYADAGSVWGYNSTTGVGGLNVRLQCPTVANNPYVRNCTGQDSTAHHLRSSVGVGLLWNSPFGPIRFDYSFVLSKAPWDRTQAFRFSGGTRF